jgi:deoxyribose-phosphate aldolase
LSPLSSAEKIINHQENERKTFVSLSSQTITLEQLAKTIDHSLLQPQLTEEEVIAGCRLAAQYHAASVCVKPYHVKLAAKLLADSDVLVSTVVGFPHGSSTKETKLVEVRQALDDGAVELDMVLNYGELRSGHADYVRDEIRAICDLAHAYKAKVKVIFENAHLSDEQKVLACKLCEEAGADWVKTSTGFAPTGATVADIKLMRASVSGKVQVKAAHGIRTLAAALEMIDAGVTRIGATATATMLEDFKKLKESGGEITTAEPSGGY